MSKSVFWSKHVFPPIFLVHDGKGALVSSKIRALRSSINYSMIRHPKNDVIGRNGNVV